MKECPVCNRCFPDQVNHCPTDGDALRFTIQGDTVLDGRYQLERRLGSGGMGIVFKGRHIFLKTQHAIKIILPDLVGNDPSLVTRFRQEAMAAAAIHHPNTISVTDFGVVNNTTPFLVMEFLEGRSLHDMITEEGRFAPARAIELMIAIASGVGAAHRQGIVHRDLKPLNIMLGTGHEPNEAVKVLDFGLAKIKSGDLLGSFVAAKTQGMMGSPFYMAPEQWGDDEPDLRADIYSLGVILYQMLTGEVPFRGSSIPAIMKKHLSSEPPSLSERGVRVPPEVEQVVARALAKEPEGRPASIEEFVADLHQALDAVRDASEATTAETDLPALFQTVAIKREETMPPPDVARTGEQHAGGVGGGTAVDVEASGGEQGGASAGGYGTAVSDAGRRTHAGGAQQPPPPVPRETSPLGSGGKTGYMQASEEITVEPPSVNAPDGSSPQRTNYAPTPRQTQPFTHDQTPPADAAGGASAAGTFGGSQAPGYGVGGAAGVAAPRFPRPLIAVVAALVVLCVVAGLFVVARRSTGVTTGAGGNTNANASAGPQASATPISRDLVALPGGTFQVGRNDVPPRSSDVSRAYQAWAYNQWPAHAVTVAPFAIDRTEVTNAEYADFVGKTGYPPPPDWGGLRPREGQEMWPVRNVSYEDALRFAAWRSSRDRVTYRLPTEDEWEYAARGREQSRLYPWGASWADGRANVESDSPKPVGSFPEGATPQGLHDMIGNLWEWTSTEAAMYRGNNVLALAPGDARKIIIRGGSYQSSARGDEPVTATSRRWVQRDKVDPVVGFRLVRAAQ